ncbi:SH3 domain-containing protein [Novosphingobium sp.]|uniref:SH3 domain-containing protein n=1 Tax=Novosphingobium sp. TaxID=1874826 RepID=UPI00260B82CF|nr:SH3 domain-containing protein [Novosphingobium sp.]
MRSILTLAALVAAAMPLGSASAQTMRGYVSGPTRIYSGPLRDYPSVRTLRRGTRVSVLGCLRDWTWCDVIYHGTRGWIAGNALRVRHDGRRRGIGADMGVGVTTFTFGSYWDNHYRGRSFYGQRQRWQSQSDNAYRAEWGEREQRRNEGADHDRHPNRGRLQGEDPHGQDHRSGRERRKDQQHRPMLSPQSMAAPYRLPDLATMPRLPDRPRSWSGSGSNSDIDIVVPGVTTTIRNPSEAENTGYPHH